MQKRSTSLMLGIGLLGLVACGGGGKALISQSEIDAAKRSGTLQSLYRKASGFVETSKGSSKEEAINLQSKIGGLLVAEKGAEVDSVLNKFESGDTSVTRSKLKASKASIEEMKNWSETSYTLYTAKLDSAISKMNQKITALVNQAENNDEGKVASILTYRKAAELAGSGEAETIEYEKRYAQAMEQFSYQGSDALNKGLYSTALESAKNALLLDPGNIQFDSMLSQAQAGLFEKDFRFALENGKPESAYQALLKVADEPIFLQLKKSMGRSIILLSNFFASNAAKNYQKGDLVAAYNDLSKGRLIQEKLEASNKGFVQEKGFLDLVMKSAKNEKFGIGKREALLRVIGEFDQAYPQLSSEALKLKEEIKGRALTKLSVDEFKEVQTNDAISASVGRRIGSKLEKILFERLGNEVLIVTGNQASEASAYQGLALKIDGEVLQAAIESNVNRGQRSKSVQTGVQKTETEAYKEWAKRSRGTAPERYTETPVMEDVVLTVEHIRKQAIAEVAFRIIEPATSKILLTDNFVKEASYSGESINEFQKGDFHQAYLPADLPTDIKIMDELATELAGMLGDKLSEYLKNPEQVFYQKASEAKAQNDIAGAIELLANAIYIAESKGNVNENWLAEIKELSLQ